MTKSPPPPASLRLRAWTENSGVAVALIVALIALAWGGSLRSPFVFDDQASIVDNSTLRHLVPPAWLHPPATAGETVSGRPLLNATFALNYAVGALDVRGYHIANLLIHAASAFVLWEILRRLPGLGGGVALAAALVWVVHPLQTAAVTYVVQRAESLAALLGLLALYGFMRGAVEGKRTWFGLAFASCFIGVGAKETIAVIPLLVLLYDRAFVAGSFGAAWRARWKIHAALFATWLPLAVLVIANRARGGSAGAGEIGVADYALTQAGAIIHYLRLAGWPTGLVFDHGVPVVAGLSVVWWQGLLLLAIAAATLRALARNRPVGFAGAGFFLLLAPSSSIVPVITQTIAEHRMYLALAVPVALACAGAAASLRRFALPAVTGPVVAGIAVIALGLTTFQRNRVYQTELSLWSDTVAKVPANPRAHYNLGLVLRRAGRVDEASAEFQRTLALQPNHAFAHFQLGTFALTAGRAEEASGRFEAALAADPHYADARVNLGQALLQLGRNPEAIAEFRRALADEPNAADVRVNLAAALVATNQPGEAETLLREALALSPDLPEAHYQLGLALAKTGRAAEAETEFRAALQLRPAWSPALLALGNAAAARGDTVAAESAFAEALRADPTALEAHYARGNLLAKQQRFAEAMAEYRTVLERDPAHVPARNNLANCQLFTGQLDEAIANYEAVLRVRGADAAVERNLALARELRRR